MVVVCHGFQRFPRLLPQRQSRRFSETHLDLLYSLFWRPLNSCHSLGLYPWRCKGSHLWECSGMMLRSNWLPLDAEISLALVLDWFKLEFGPPLRILYPHMDVHFRIHLDLRRCRISCIPPPKPLTKVYNPDYKKQKNEQLACSQWGWEFCRRGIHLSSTLSSLLFVRCWSLSRVSCEGQNTMAPPLLKSRSHPSHPRMTTPAFLRSLRLYMSMVLPLYHAAHRGCQCKKGPFIFQKLKQKWMQLYPLGNQSSLIPFSHVCDT